MEKFCHHSLIMDRGWLWKEFIEKLPNSFPKLSKPSILTVSASYFPIEKASFLESPDGFLKQKEDFEASKVFFKLNPNLTITVLDEKFNPKNPTIVQYFKKNIVTLKSISDLKMALANIPDKDWIWIDFYVGNIISRNSNKGFVRQIWERELKNWIPWLRNAN